MMTRENAIYEIKQLAVLSTNNKNIERITEALNMAIEALQDEIWKDEPCDKCVFVKGSGWCDNCNGKPKGLDALPNSRKAEQTEPQTETQMKTQNSNLTFEKDECAKEYEELGLKELKELINADRKTENSSEKPNNCETQTDCTEALTLLWIKNMVTDEEFYRIDARLKCISCKWWNDTIVGGSECVSKECTYQPKDEPQTDCAWK